MRIKFLNYLIYGIIALFFLNCKETLNKNSFDDIEEKSTPKPNSNLNNSESEYSIYSEIEIIIENECECLLLNQPTLVYLKKENIYKYLKGLSIEENKSMDLNGPKIDTSGLRFVLTATEGDLQNGNIKIQVTEGETKGTSHIHKIKIPVKE